MASKLGWWLSTLSPDQLAEILTRRPDALAPPAPRSLRELAERLESRPSVSVAFHGLPTPAVQIVEALQALGGPAVDRAALAAAVGCTSEDPDLDAALRVLTLRALVWPEGSDLHMVGPLWTAFPYPLRLGPPAARLLGPRSAAELRKMADGLGLPPDRNKQHLVASLVATLDDPQRVRAAVAQGSPETQTILQEVAWNGPIVQAPDIIYGYGHSDHPALEWALSRGLLVADGWQSAVMPAEVGRALRGPEWRAPFTPRPPEPPLTQADPAAVAREAAAAAGSAVAAVTALLEHSATAPATLLKAGGIGTREQRRLARATGCDEPAVRLWLELAYAAKLVAVADDVSPGGRHSPEKAAVLPTEAYDAWRSGEPADRLAPLLLAWWSLPAAPLAKHSPSGDPAPAALTRTAFGEVLAGVRQELLRAVAALPPGQRIAAQAVEPALVELVNWRSPLLLGAIEDPADLVTAVWREAELLGVLALGAATPLGEALLAGDGDGLTTVARDLLPDAVSRAMFQADLTAVVPGTPTAACASLLDSSADRESAGGAASWRFCPASVRRALDAGATAPELIAALRGIAAGGALPQPLEYLITDVARRHGEVRVRAVACVLRADDPRLLAEIAAARALAPLRLALLAPTVLASGKPAVETLAALRSAGYAPVGEDGNGVTTVERVAPRRATPRQRRPVAVHARKRPATGAVTDPRTLATTLLAAGPPVVEPVAEEVTPPRKLRLVPVSNPDDPEEMIGFFAPRLPGAERRLLAHAVEHGGRVEIHYTNAQGTPSVRVIEPTAVLGHLMEAWCHLREDERMFALERIHAVAPA